MSEIYLVQPNDINTVWQDCEPILKRVLDHSYGEMSLHGIHHLLITNKAHLWVITDKRIIACVVTEIFQYELKRTLRGLFLAGSRMDEWLPDLNTVLMNHGKNYQCKDIEFYGRKGWVKKLKSLNYEEGYNMLRKDIG